MYTEFRYDGNMKASERAYKTLLDEIVAGDLAPGAVLGEVEQSSRLGISRTPLREALFRLHADGLLTNPTGRGAIVTDISSIRARKLFVVRMELESLAGRLAARNSDKQVFRDLSQEFGGAVETLNMEDGSIRNYYSLNDRFDEAINASTENEYLVANLGVMRRHAARFRRVARKDLSRLVASAIETKQICDAIVDHDEERAVLATATHLKNSLDFILGSFFQGSNYDAPQTEAGV